MSWMPGNQPMACTAFYNRRPSSRRSWPFLVIGLTGSVAMGKSTAAKMITRMGIPVFDADATVHGLTGPNGPALPAIAERFAGIVGDNGVDRQALGKTVFKDASALADLEAILHPLVRARRNRFLQEQALKRSRCVVLDVPLLFETGGDSSCDAVIVVSAPAFLQRQRSLARPGMTAETFAGILSHQMPDQQKRRQADVVIPSGLGKHETWRQLKQALLKMISAPAS